MLPWVKAPHGTLRGYWGGYPATPRPRPMPHELAAAFEADGPPAPFVAIVVPGRAQRTAAWAVSAALLVLFLAALPQLHRQLAPLRLLVPPYQAVLVLIALTTAWLLLAQARMLRSPALLLLCCAYWFSACMAAAFALSFPGLGSGPALPGAGAQTTAWLYFAWHGGFALGVLSYALAPAPAEPAPQQATRPLRVLPALAATTVLALGCVVLATAAAPWLPPLMRGDSDLGAKLVVALCSLSVGVLALLQLLRRRAGSLLDLWLRVTMLAWVLAVLLAGVLNHGRFDLAWYLGRVCTLLGDATVLLVLLLESNLLYERLADMQLRERALSLRRLRASEARFEATFEQAAVGMALVDPQGRWLRVNPRLCEILGYTAEQLVGSSSLDVLHPMDAIDSQQARQGLLQGTQSYSSAERRMLRKDGSEVWVQSTVALVRREDGAPDYFIVVIEDIQERKLLQRQILEVATAEQERIGHEIHDGIGQQLTALTLLASGLQRRLQQEGRSADAEALAQLRTHLEATLTQARALARGLASVDVDRQGLGDALRALAGGVRAASGLDCRYIGLTEFELDTAEQAVHLLRIAQEGLHNALRHSGATRIELRLQVQRDELVLQVLDDGMGIEEPPPRSGRLGLHIMAYRAGEIGARLYLRRRHQGGTELRCVMPLARRAAEPLPDSPGDEDEFVPAPPRSTAR